MIDHLTLGVEGASAGTRVDASHLITRLTSCTIRAGDALGPTALVRIAKVIWQATAGAGSVGLFANGICAAWRGVTGLLWRRIWY